MAEANGAGASQTELVFGLVGPIGTRLDKVADELEELLGNFGYKPERIKVSNDVIAALPTTKQPIPEGHYDRAWYLMTAGNAARESAEDAGILAHGVANLIQDRRKTMEDPPPDRAAKLPRPAVAYVIDSLKNPAEVEVLRDCYGNGFYLVGVHEDLVKRQAYLQDEKRYTPQQLKDAIERDQAENAELGQQTRKTFELADFFVDRSSDPHDALKRFLDIVFGNPLETAQFDEFAMFLAFATSFRSGDIARQVGAVLVSPDREVLAVGSNDVPAYGGGPYWHDTKGGDHRDIAVEEWLDAEPEDEGIHDPNRREIGRIIRDIGKKLDLDNLAGALKAVGVELPESAEWTGLIVEEVIRAARTSRLGDLTEFGRSVHAEMEALMACSRRGVPVRGATLYCTTFPCHNCAKHIIDAGVKRVVYVEPYPKSRAYELHSDAVQAGATQEGEQSKVEFIPFVGVGPRRYLDLFSLRLGAGRHLERKSGSGQRLEWERKDQKPRLPMEPRSYLENEQLSADIITKWKEGLHERE